MTELDRFLFVRRRRCGRFFKKIFRNAPPPLGHHWCVEHLVDNLVTEPRPGLARLHCRLARLCSAHEEAWLGTAGPPEGCGHPLCSNCSFAQLSQ